MSDDFFANLSAKVEAKDQKTSIRNKYKRRLRDLALTLDDFITHAEIRLDAQRAGRIHKREETEKLLGSCKTLRAAIPMKNPADEEMDDRVFRNLCDVFGIDPDAHDSDSDEKQSSQQPDA